VLCSLRYYNSQHEEAFPNITSMHVYGRVVHVQGYQHLRRRNLRHLVRHVSPGIAQIAGQQAEAAQHAGQQTYPVQHVWQEVNAAQHGMQDSRHVAGADVTQHIKHYTAYSNDNTAWYREAEHGTRSNSPVQQAQPEAFTAQHSAARHAGQQET
jgi:hypothetical protein